MTTARRRELRALADVTFIFFACILIDKDARKTHGTAP